MTLKSVDRLHGEYLVLDGDPDVLTFHNAVYSPFGLEGSTWGLFDHSRKLITQGGFWQNSVLPSQSSLNVQSYGSVQEEAPDASYVYVGIFHEHYGHFLLSTFCRYWNQELLRDTSRKLLFHSDHDIEYWFAKPHVSAILRGLDLTPDRFRRFDRPVRIGEVIVPAPGMEESSYCHSGFARAANALGRRLAEPYLAPVNRPVYLSKAQLSAGVGCIVNEQALTDRLKSAGFEIVFPEKLAFEEQVALYYNHPIVCGQTGSALHTSLFAPGRKILGLCFINSNFSSYPMIDEANGTCSRYCWPDDDIEPVDNGSMFHNSFRLTDPARTADEFLQLMGEMQC